MTSNPSEVNIKRGKYIVISSPSGGGKTTIIKQLLDQHDDFTYSVSATTRKQRGGEVNGDAYWFLSREDFTRKRDRGDLLEWEEVYGDYYGTPRDFAEEAVGRGQHVLFDLDVKGALKLKQNLPETLLIFLMPPSLEILEERLRSRNSEDEETLRRRLDLVQFECSQAEKYDYTVINDHLDSTVRRIEEIIKNYIIEDGVV